MQDEGWLKFGGWMFVYVMLCMLCYNFLTCWGWRWCLWLCAAKLPAWRSGGTVDRSLFHVEEHLAGLYGNLAGSKYTHKHINIHMHTCGSHMLQVCETSPVVPGYSAWRHTARSRIWGVESRWLVGTRSCSWRRLTRPLSPHPGCTRACSADAHSDLNTHTRMHI